MIVCRKRGGFQDRKKHIHQAFTLPTLVQRAIFLVRLKLWGQGAFPLFQLSSGNPKYLPFWIPPPFLQSTLVAHDCGYPLSRYTCRATRVAADFLDFITFYRCSTGVALHPLKFWCRTSPPPVPGGVAPKFGSEKVSRYTGVSQLQLRVSRYTVQLSKAHPRQFQPPKCKLAPSKM